MKCSLATLLIAILSLYPAGNGVAADPPAKVKVLAESTKFGPDNDDQFLVGAVIRNAQELAEVIHFNQTPAQAIEYATKGFGIPVDFTKHVIVTISLRSTSTPVRGDRTGVKVEVTGVEVLDSKLRLHWKANVEPDAGPRSRSYLRAWLMEKFDGEIVFAPAFPKPKPPFVERLPIFKTVPVEFGDTRLYNRKQHHISNEKKSEPACVAIRSAREWAELLGSYNYEKAMQEAARALEVEYVNFEKQILLFVYPGQQSRSGYHTDVLSVTKQGNALLVKWNHVYPPSGGDSFTGSYRRGELILMEKFHGLIKFEPVSEDPPIIPASPAALAKRPMKVVQQAVYSGKMDHPGDRMPVEKVARNYTELARLLRVDQRDAYDAADALFKCGPIDFNKYMVVASSPGAVPGDRFEAGLAFLVRDVYISSAKQQGESL